MSRCRPNLGRGGERIALWRGMWFCATLAASTAQAANWVHLEKVEPHMGTQVAISLYASDEAVANRGLAEAFARIAALDRMMSDYREDSELSQLGRSAPSSSGQPTNAVRVSPEILEILVAADAISRASAGAFDVSVGPLSRLWRRARRRHELPHEEQIQQALGSVGYQYIDIDRAQQTVTLRRPNLRLDFGGIAKGYASDQALAVLKQHGIDRASVNAGGGLSLGERPPGQEGWKVAISQGGERTAPSKWVRLQNCGIATSGDTFQHVVLNGKRYSHIVDPRTGWALTESRMATVISPSGMMADALATAACVLGPDEGLSLVAQFPGSTALIGSRGSEDETSWRTASSPSFPVLEATPSQSSDERHWGESKSPIPPCRGGQEEEQ